jgi:hypothetical protein
MTPVWSRAKVCQLPQEIYWITKLFKFGTSFGKNNGSAYSGMPVLDFFVCPKANIYPFYVKTQEKWPPVLI